MPGVIEQIDGERIMIKLVSMLGILLILIVICSPTTMADQTLKVSMIDNLKPYMWLNEHANDNGVIGPDIDLIKEIGSRVGATIELFPVPFKRVMMLTKSGEVDIGLGFKTRSREEFATFLGPHPMHWAVYKVFVKKGNEFTFNSIDDLYGKTIGKNLGYAIGKKFDAAVEEGKIKVHEVNSFNILVRILEMGRVPAIVGNSNSISIEIIRMNYSDKIESLPNPISKPRGAFLMMSKASKLKNREDMVHKINQAIEDMGRDGTFMRLGEKYPGYQWAP